MPTTTAPTTVSNRRIFVSDGDKVRKKSTKLANAMALELMQYGIQVDDEIIRRISRKKKTAARNDCDTILAMFTIGTVNPPLFANWEQRTEFTFEERIVQFLAYAFQVSGNDLVDPDYMAGLRSRVNFKAIKKLELSGDDEAIAKFQSLLNSTVALDRKSRGTLLSLASTFYEAGKVKSIRSHQARAAVIIGQVDNGISLRDALAGINVNPADVLRYLAGRLDWDHVTLPHNVKYATVGWEERLAILDRLETFDLGDLCEAMGNNRTA